MSRERGSKLVTPYPHHIPGYGGYCPQFKYHYGSPFGSITHKLLAEPGEETAHSDQPLLRETCPPDDAPDVGTAAQWEDSRVIETRERSGDEKLLDPVIPGYQGFVPKLHNHHFGRTNAQVCRSSIADFQRDQQRHRSRVHSLLTHTMSQPRVGHRRSHTSPPFVSKDTPPPTMSPMKMREGDPLKHFKASYAGFVPHWRNNEFANTFQVGTTNAVRDFNRQQFLQDTWRGMSMDVRAATPRTPLAKGQGTMIYPEGSGMVPHYTGHVPGEKFKFGQPYGTSTANRLPPIVS